MQKPRRIPAGAGGKSHEINGHKQPSPERSSPPSSGIHIPLALWGFKNAGVREVIRDSLCCCLGVRGVLLLLVAPGAEEITAWLFPKLSSLPGMLQCSCNSNFDLGILGLIPAPGMNGRTDNKYRKGIKNTGRKEN